jgi:hypothetical protein
MMVRVVILPVVFGVHCPVLEWSGGVFLMGVS